jgi:hypothetical protein
MFCLYIYSFCVKMKLSDFLHPFKNIIMYSFYATNSVVHIMVTHTVTAHKGFMPQ